MIFESPLFYEMIIVKADSKIPFESLIKSFTKDTLGCHCTVTCIKEIPKFIWIPAKKKYIVIFHYRRDIQLAAIKGYIQGVCGD